MNLPVSAKKEYDNGRRETAGGARGDLVVVTLSGSLEEDEPSRKERKDSDLGKFKTGGELMNPHS